MIDKSVEAVKKIIKALDREDSPLLEIIDIVAKQQHEKYPGQEVFKGISLDKLKGKK